MSEIGPETFYCFSCGKRVKRESPTEQCWYCGAPTRRAIRPPRHCAFCDQPISHKAVKCRHCGEFLDGRPGAGGAPTQITFVIDKAIFQGDAPVTLAPGQPLPEHVAAHLTDRTREAIRDAAPALIDQPGVRALPAPDARVDPMLPGDTPSADSPGRSEAQRYRVCSTCSTEVLATDNFCLHCGMPLRGEGIGSRAGGPRRARGSNLVYFGASSLCTAGFMCVALFADRVPFAWRPFTPGHAIAALASASFLLLIAAFFRIRTSANQILAIGLLCVWAVALALVLLL